jgi:hypothetical protein
LLPLAAAATNLLSLNASIKNARAEMPDEDLLCRRDQKSRHTSRPGQTTLDRSKDGLGLGLTLVNSKQHFGSTAKFEVCHFNYFPNSGPLFAHFSNLHTRASLVPIHDL